MHYEEELDLFCRCIRANISIMLHMSDLCSPCHVFPLLSCPYLVSSCSCPHLSVISLSPSTPGNSAGSPRRRASMTPPSSRCPSSRGPPRNHWTKMEGRDPPVSGECPGPSQNLPAVVRGSPESAAVRGISRPACNEYGKPAGREYGKPSDH